MADNQEKYTYDGRADAQLANTRKRHQSESVARARQQRIKAETCREKRWERWRARETTIVRRGIVHQPGPHQDARDHRGEVV